MEQHFSVYLLEVKCSSETLHYRANWT